ncbi:glycoside hydrolase family 18 protein [Thermothelomyces heterothallicus CBS 202.75]|uniref:glycoside hydrolase family 18 protein n=1 Tax=Thermothelomyces heterothallicus CBS 202.75 TaxID=1149848 RepID=UPI003742028A
MVHIGLFLALIASLPRTVAAGPPQQRQASLNRTQPELPRLMLYHQTTHDATGRPISLLPLVTKQHIGLTHLIVGAFHVHANGTIHLNDHPPWHPRYSTLWAETRILQSSSTAGGRSGGVKVLGMVGGAAAGSFAADTLDGDGAAAAAFEASYALLHEAVRAHALDGVDLDVEEPMSLRGAVRLVRRLRADFGPRFVISFAPVATALLGTGAGEGTGTVTGTETGRRGRGRGRGGAGNLSGFDYRALERAVGREIAFYNAQFYNGFGGMADTRLFDAIVGEGWEPDRIVIGQLTSPENGGGFVGHERLARTVERLRRKHGEIGGVAGWEYFNAVPGGSSRPWEWAESMTRILRPPGTEPVLRITREMAERLSRAWMVSAAEGGGGEGGAGGISSASGLGTAERRVGLAPNIDYMAMVNA